MGASACVHDMLAAAEARRITETGESVARPRWQGGWLFKRGKKNPVWVGRYREDAIAQDGTRIRRQRSVVLGLVSETGRREAQRRLNDRLTAINQGRHRPELMADFEHYVVDRWEPVIYPLLRFSTSRNYKHLVRRHLLPFFGKMRLPEIGSAEVQMFLAQKSKVYSPKTVLSLRNLLSKVFGTAQKWGYLQVNPARGTQVPALVVTRERITLSAEQVRALLVHLIEPYKTMVLLAVLSGLRRAEIIGLRWKYVDLANGSVRVAESNYEGKSAAPKTQASRRIVFVHRAVLEALESIRQEQYQPDDFVFHTDRGTPLNPNNVLNRVIHPACKAAGIPRVSWHNFRYTYSTWANPTGESIKALQSQLGHTNSRMTLDVYTQPMPQVQKKLAGKIARVLLPVAPKLTKQDQTEGALPN